jgi:hypothetical protein
MRPGQEESSSSAGIAFARSFPLRLTARRSRNQSSRASARPSDRMSRRSTQILAEAGASRSPGDTSEHQPSDPFCAFLRDLRLSPPQHPRMTRRLGGVVVQRATRNSLLICRRFRVTSPTASALDARPAHSVAQLHHDGCHRSNPQWPGAGAATSNSPPHSRNSRQALLLACARLVGSRRCAGACPNR